MRTVISDNTRLLWLIIGLWAGLGGVASPTARAQAVEAEEETRAEALEEARREKAEALEEPDPPGPLERAVRFVEEKVQGGAAVGSGGLYGLSPVLGGLRSGAGLTFGLRFDPTGADDGLLAALSARASLRKYWGVGAVFGLDAAPFVGFAYARYRHLPQEDFYGVGPASDEAARAVYRLNEGLVGGLAGVRLLPHVYAGGHASYLVDHLGPGRDDRFPLLAEAFPEMQVPGAGDLAYLVGGGWAALDTRDVPALPGYGSRFAPLTRNLERLSLDATRGLYASAEVLRFAARGDAAADFTRLDFEAQQFIPFRRGYQRLAFREFVSLTYTPEGQDVPFYLLPALGGSRSLRGFEEFRFRDRNVLLVNAEYRWRVWLFLDMALFADAGQVFDAWSQVGWDHLEASYGAGLRARTEGGVVGRLDVARSREGWQYYVKVGAFF